MDRLRIEDAEKVIRLWAVGNGYLSPTIESSVTRPAAGRKEARFHIELGTRYRNRAILFEGASAFNPRLLRKGLRKAGLKKTVFVSQQEAVSRIERFYHRAGYLDARAGPLRVELDAPSRTARLIFPIEEGPLYKVQSVGFKGYAFENEAELRRTGAIQVGDAYNARAREKALASLEALYRRTGFADARITCSVSKDPVSAAVDMAFAIEENARSVVRQVRVEGTRRTSEAFVRRHLVIHDGDVLDPDKTARSRKKLYNTDAYSLVTITASPLDGGPGQAPVGSRAVLLTVGVSEKKPYELRYGGSYDTDRGPGVTAEFTILNFLGSGRNLGLTSRYDSDVREMRAYMGQPYFMGRPLKTTVSSYLRREYNGASTTDRRGFSLNQELPLRRHYLLSYSYRLEHAHTFAGAVDSEVPLDETVTIAPVSATLSRDTRDEILAATRGSFMSHGLELAEGMLGSDVKYIKYYGQIFRYFALSKPVVVPFGAGTRKPRWVFASGLRLGLAAGLAGQDVDPSERFFAGGGTTLRGFAYKAVGPVDRVGEPLGGAAVIIVNNEIRFPVGWVFGGVGFLDAGNVYPKVGDFDLSELRVSAGTGLRVYTPYFLLRFDYGWKLERKPGESPGAFFFSIGQAF